MSVSSWQICLSRYSLLLINLTDFDLKCRTVQRLVVDGADALREARTQRGGEGSLVLLKDS